MQLGLENKKQTMWAAVLGVVAVLALAYEVIPVVYGIVDAGFERCRPPLRWLTCVAPRQRERKPGRKPRVENLDPTLRLDLLAASEQTMYEGNGRNIFVSQAEDVVFRSPMAPGITGRDRRPSDTYVPPSLRRRRRFR